MDVIQAHSASFPYRTITPYLIVQKGAAFIEFLSAALDAKEILKKFRPDGTIMHAELEIGDSIIMLGESNEMGGTLKAGIFLYVDKVDSLYKKALNQGASGLQAPADMPHGLRMGGVQDIEGNQWWIASAIS